MSVIDIKPDAQGKVRDLYDLGDKLLLVASDRISAFDYILEDEIPYKGQVLTQLSCFWFDLLSDVVDNHLISADVADLPEQFKPYADNAVFHFTFGGEHDDGRVGVVADNAAYTLTGNTREHQVEHNQIEVMLGKLFQSLLTVAHGSYPIVLAFEICRHRIADGLFVFHEKDTTSAFVH